MYELLTTKPEQPLCKEVASSLWAVLKTIGRYYESAKSFKYLHIVPRPLFQWEYHSKQSCERQAAQPQPCFPPKEPSAPQHKVVSAFIYTQIGNNCATIKTGGVRLSKVSVEALCSSAPVPPAPRHFLFRLIQTRQLQSREENLAQATF